MGEPTFSYSVDNDRLFRTAIERALAEVKDLRVPFNQIAFDWYKGNKAIFKLQSKGLYPDLSTKPFHAWWDKERDSKKRPIFYAGGYKEYKRKKFGFEYPILKATGRLEASVTDNKGLESIFINTGKSITLGTQVPYAIYHQSDKARKRIPLRKFIFIGPEAPSFATNEQKGRPERWLNIINNYVLKKMGAKVK